MIQCSIRQYFCMNCIDNACMHKFLQNSSRFLCILHFIFQNNLTERTVVLWTPFFHMILIHSSPKKIPSGSFMLLISLSKITGQRKLNFWDEISFIFLKFNKIFATLGPGRRQWRTISFMSNNFPRRWSAMFHSDRFKLNIRNNGSRFFQEKIYVALFKGVILGSPVSLNS